MILNSLININNFSYLLRMILGSLHSVCRWHEQAMSSDLYINKDEGKLENGLCKDISTGTDTICSYYLLQEILVSHGKFDNMYLWGNLKKVWQKCCDSCRRDFNLTMHCMGQNYHTIYLYGHQVVLYIDQATKLLAIKRVLTFSQCLN